MLKGKNGITLMSLIIIIILLLILAGVAIKMITGWENIPDNTITAVEEANIGIYKERIELAILEEILRVKKITMQEALDKIVESNIATEENINRDTNQIKTDLGYIFEIKKENGNWIAEYIGKGELQKNELSLDIIKDIEVLTSKVTLTIIGKADSGIKSYTPSHGEGKTYPSKTKAITETMEITQNGTYTFTVENQKGKTETKEIVIGNILSGVIALDADEEGPTKYDVKVTVVWPEGSDAGEKEIQVGDGEWNTYTGETSEVVVTQNCTVRAKISSAVGQVTAANLTIDNIDKLTPKEFTPRITEITSNSITIEGSTEDQSATEKYASNEIIAYYFRMDDGEWVTNQDKTQTSYTFTKLTQNSNHTFQMKAIDAATNEQPSEIISGTVSGIAGAESITIVPKDDVENWINTDVRIEVTWPANTEGLTKEIKIGDNEWKPYVGEETISENCTISAKLVDKEKQEGTSAQLTINKIDKIKPEVSISPNGGSGYTMPTSGNATIKATLTASDSGGSTVVTRQYAWSQSGTAEPTSGWTNFTDGTQISKTDITAAGNWFLWTKVIDGATNRAEVTKVSNAFVIGEKTAAANMITLTPNYTKWTNTDVTVTVSYGANLTQSQTLTCDGTSGTNYTKSGNTITVKTNNQTVTATAKDKAGNTISATLKITVIDKTGPGAPTISGGNSSSSWATSRKIQVDTAPTDTGIGTIANYEYYVASNSTVPTASTTATGSLGAGVTSKTFNDRNYNGEYVYFRAVDGLGNKGAWSSYQRLYVDINKPTVSVKSTATAEVTEGTNTAVALSTYFNTSANGNAPITSTVYTDTSKNNAVVTTTGTLAVGTHVIRCTVTKENGLSDYADKTIKIVSAGPAVNSSGLATENFTIKPSASSNVQIVIPTGWAPAILEGSNSTTSLPTQSGKVKSIMPAEQWNNITVEQINKGIVIVNGTTNFEEYVWVPIPDSESFKRTAWTTKYTYNSSGEFSGENEVVHPLAEQKTTNKWWDDKTTTNYSSMVSSVNNNKGFYVGRYEASKMSSTVPQSARGKTVWNKVALANIKTYISNSSIPNIHLMYGVEWDSMFNWFIGNAIIGSATNGSTKTMELSDIQTSSKYWGNVKDATGGASSGKGSIRATGYNEYWKANNIYDVAGNVNDQTQEIWSSGGEHACRGSDCLSACGAAVRAGLTDSAAYDYYGFRMSFYI